MPRPRSTTPAAVAKAALSVIDRNGLAGLSLRAVAGQLGMGVMSLYRYVASRDELEALIADLLMADLDLAVPDHGPWVDKAALLAGRVWRAGAAHPGALPLVLTQPACLRGWNEATLGVLADAGFDGERRMIAARTLRAYLLGAMQTSNGEDDLVRPQAAFEAGLGLVLRGIRTG